MEGADRKAQGASDLRVRTLSAVVMLAVAGGALWAGGWFWGAFVLIVATICLNEFRLLVWLGTKSQVLRTTGLAFGVVYVVLASLIICVLRVPLVYDANAEQANDVGLAGVMTILGIVVATDVGAYFSGRTFGGPKIAPAISPSKTWAGLFGGMFCAALWCLLASEIWSDQFGLSTLLMSDHVIAPLAIGSGLAVVAQAGDFLESWMKRRAGVKDSSKLIPGHGGIFDRVDGLLAVCFAIGVFSVFGVELV